MFVLSIALSLKALELVFSPYIFFSDEPTSGLDASSSSHIISAMRNLATMRGILVACIVHQPSSSCFQSFDDLLLLEQGGKVNYMGDIQYVSLYFGSLGFVMDRKNENIADILLDITERLLYPQNIRSSAAGDTSSEKGCILDLAKEWQAYIECNDLNAQVDEDATVSSSSSSSSLLSSEVLVSLSLPATPYHRLPRNKKIKAVAQIFTYYLISHFVSLVNALKDVVIHFIRSMPFWTMRSDKERMKDSEMLIFDKHQPGFLHQLRICCYREFVQICRRPLSMSITYSIVAISGMSLGATAETSLPIDDGTIEYSIIILSLLAAIAGQRVFTKDFLMFQREACSGLNRYAYFCSKIIFELVGCLSMSLVYFILYASAAHPVGSNIKHYLLNVLLFFTVSGLSMFISVSMGGSRYQHSSSIVAIVLILVMTNRNTITNILETPLS